MAFAGLHPVVAVYATFLNRAFDQVLMDVALHRAGVTIVLDRAGVTGDDGASHNGMWDLSMLGLVPGVRVAAPRDEETLRRALREAVAVSDGPTVVRFPKGRLAEPLPAVGDSDGVDLLHADPEPAGAARRAWAAWPAWPARPPPSCPPRACRWPSPPRCGSLRCRRAWWSSPARSAGSSRWRTTAWSAGSGRAWRPPWPTPGSSVRMERLGIPQEFLDHAGRPAILERLGLTAQGCADAARRVLDPPD